MVTTCLFIADEVDPDLPPSVEVISERKRFYFDVKRNDMGVFLQISEVADSLDSHVVSAASLLPSSA